MTTQTTTASKRFNFTMSALERLQPPQEGRLRVYDTKTRWLTLRVTPDGAKAFYLYRKVNGRARQICLGSFPPMTVDQARDRAAEINVQLGHGQDPVQAKRAAKAETTLQALFNNYLAGHALPHKKSADGDEAQFDRYLDSWRARRLSEINLSDVQHLHARIGKDHGRYAANRLLALLSKMFNFARTQGYTGGNPCQGVKKFREQSRERFLHADEFPKFYKALMAEPNETLRDFFLVALFTGARRGNVQAMRWEHVNLDRGIWTIPAAQAKAGDQLTVYLSAASLEVLKTRRDAAAEALAAKQRDEPQAKHEASPWVFPSRRSDAKSPHLIDPKGAWKRILKAASLTDLRVHDLRRTMGSWQAATGASLSVIGKSLGHKNTATTAVYARLNLDPVKSAVDLATDAMLKAAMAAPTEEGKP